jgi:predicted ABC-type ATPase
MDAGDSFVLESTLSGNYLMKIIEKAHSSGYAVKIIYIFLESPQDCIQRIKIRVRLGGHSIPDEDVIRRIYRSKDNFWKVYKNLSTEWVIIYNSETHSPQRVAFGVGTHYFIEEENLFANFIKDIKQ